MSHKQRTLVSSNKNYSTNERTWDRIINKFKKILTITKKKEDQEYSLLSKTKSYRVSNESLNDEQTELTSTEYSNFYNESYEHEEEEEEVVTNSYETNYNLTYFSQYMQHITLSDKCRKQLIAGSSQQTVKTFSEQFPEERYKNVERLDSGAYGDIFICNDIVIGKNVVLKVIRAIAEHFQDRISGESLSDLENFNDIINEVMISSALSMLHNRTRNEMNEEFEAHCFPFVFDKCLVDGDIPEYFFSEHKHSEDLKANIKKKLTPIRNVAFECYPNIPREYAVIKMNYCGEPIWKVIKENRVNAIQLLSVAKQITYGLAIAETVYQFEHRDLHISNVLLKKTDENTSVKFVHRSHTYLVESNGYKVKIIDNTFSRIKIGKNIYYKDMRHILRLKSKDGEHDNKETLQERIYQDMIKETKNHWKSWTPKTNVLWLYYIYKSFSKCSLVADSDDFNTKQFFAKLIHLILKCKKVEDVIPYLE